jgi:hypothetical protein
MTKEEALNVAGQCRATASHPLAYNISVDGGSGLLHELLIDAAKVIEALAQPEQDYPENFIHALAFHTTISDLEPEQEPVAYLCENAVGHKYFRWKKPSSTYKPVALYTTPPQRTWVSLKDDEVWEWFRDNTALTNESGKRIYKAIEAKLKEKNT